MLPQSAEPIIPPWSVLMDGPMFAEPPGAPRRVSLPESEFAEQPRAQHRDSAQAERAKDVLSITSGLGNTFCCARQASRELGLGPMRRKYRRSVLASSARERLSFGALPAFTRRAGDAAAVLARRACVLRLAPARTSLPSCPSAASTTRKPTFEMAASPPLSAET